MALRKYLYLLIHGPYGTGKTTLGHTAPGPICVLDAEGGSLYVDKDIVLWDPRDPIPGGLNTDTSVVVDVQDWETYRLVLDIILSGDHPFKSLLVDSLTEIQKQLKDALLPDNEFGSYTKADYDIWDQLLTFMEADARKLRNLARPGHKNPINVVIVAASNVEEYPRRPILQGALRRSLPGFVDVEGYLHAEEVMNEKSGQKVKRRVLDIDPHDEATAEVKCRPGELVAKHGDAIWDPNIKRMLRTINPRPKAKATEGDK